MELKNSSLVPSGPSGIVQSSSNVKKTEGTRPDCHAVGKQSERNGPGMLTHPGLEPQGGWEAPVPPPRAPLKAHNDPYW